MWSCLAISYKVFISVPTRIKQNHPRGTHKKTDLKKWLPMVTFQKEKKKKKGVEKKENTRTPQNLMTNSWVLQQPTTNIILKALASWMPPGLFWANLGYSIVSVASQGSGYWNMCPFAWPLPTGCGENDLSGHSRPPSDSWRLFMWFLPSPST